jgi:hypothetical protein
MTMQQADLKLDGNAIAGMLSDIFATEMTISVATCGGCGATRPLGAVDVYTNAPGAVVRCPSCEQVLMRIVRGRDRYWIDLRGMRCLEVAP